MILRMNTKSLHKVVELMNTQAALARSLGVSKPTVNQWVNARRPVPARFCVLIEHLTKGAVTRQDLRPQDYWRIWPDLPEPTKTDNVSEPSSRAAINSGQRP